MTDSELSRLLDENSRRNLRQRQLNDRHDPLHDWPYPPDDIGSWPAEAIEHARRRCRTDFEFWAALCVRIRHKLTGADIPFILNRPQRRVLAILEEQRRAGRPLRLIMLKARQWGGSTLVQMYMAWIQTVLATNWHSIICAHVKDSSSNIRGIYAKMLQSYPTELWEGDSAPQFVPFERMTNTRIIAGRGCRVTVASSENQDAARGNDFAMAHMSEVAFWSDSRQRSPEAFIRAICGSIARIPLSLIAMESTANGVGNFFHREWLRATSAEGSDKAPVFVPWHEIDIYAEPVDDPQRLWESLDQYERDFWEHDSLTLEQICWYHNKRREYPDHAQMMAEYPSTPQEAFANTGNAVFNHRRAEALAASCCRPLLRGTLAGNALKGPQSLTGIRFVADENGLLELWQQPDPAACSGYRHAYIVAVDIGGRSAGSDWSVIAVLRRYPPSSGKASEIVAQWRGHCDHDLLAWLSARIATWYGNALLVFESNTLESEAARGDHGIYILSELRRHYRNLYCRRVHDTTEAAETTRLGFHTNRATKTMIIDNLVSAVRDADFTERSRMAIDEMITYRHTPDGRFEAASGCHDDVLMTRAILLQVSREHPIAVRSDFDPLLCPALEPVRQYR